MSPRKKTAGDLGPLLGSKWKRKKDETGSLPKDLSKRKKRATISERPSGPDIAENDVRSFERICKWSCACAVAPVVRALQRLLVCLVYLVTVWYART